MPMLNIKDGNKLICDFMFPKVQDLREMNGEEVTAIIFEQYQDVPFHKDWNLLMDVIDHLEQTCIKKEAPIFIIDQHKCEIEMKVFTKDRELIIFQGETKILAVYEAITTYLVWYFENLKKT